MNGIFACIILALIIKHFWRRTHFIERWNACLQAALESLERRDYSLSGLSSTVCQGTESLLAELHTLVEKGQLQPPVLRSLLVCLRDLQQQQNQRDQQGFTVMLRLSLAAVIALGAALILDQSWLLDLHRNPPAFLILLGYVLISVVWLRRLPLHSLLQSQNLMLDFIRAWFGCAHQGPWQKTLDQLEQDAWDFGRSSAPLRWIHLDSWLKDANREQLRRLQVAEELFGIIELLSSVYFLAVGCFFPLLKRFGL